MRGWLAVSAATVGAVAIALASFACRKATDEPRADASVGFDDLGKPCTTHAQCQQGVCVAKIGGTVEGGQGVCSVDCSATSPCLAGWQCIAQQSGRDVCQCRPSEEVCDRADNDCNGIIDDALEPCECVLKPDTCSGRCVDLQTDTNHCGRCGAACPPNAQCNQGTCVCAPGAEACTTGCADLRTDEANCGACDVHCAQGATCVEGACRCAASAGDTCTAPASAESRSFCDGDGACRTATTIALGSECLGVTNIVSHPTSVAVACKRKVRQPSEIYVAGATGATSCGTAFKPALSTNGTTLLFSSTATVDGGTATELLRCAGGQKASVQANLSAFSALDVGSDLYWVAGDELYRCPVGGCSGAPVKVASVAGLGAGPIVTDASSIYAIQGTELVRIDATNGALTSLATLATGSAVTALVLDQSRLLLVTNAGIASCPTSGCPAGPTVVVTAADVSGVSIDASRLWWKSGNAIYRCSSAGTCVPTKVFETPAATDVFGADELGLYVGGERLERIAK